MSILHDATSYAEEMKQRAQKAEKQVAELQSELAKIGGYWLVHSLANKIERMCPSCERQLDCECQETDLCITEWCASCLSKWFMERHRGASEFSTSDR